MSKWYEIKNASDDTAEILIYDLIGLWPANAEQFVRDLESVKASNINLRINSKGGSSIDAFAIYNALKRNPARVVAHVDGVAASAATYPMLAADEVRMAKNAMMLIHNPVIPIADGEAGELRRVADMLDKLRDNIINLYADETGGEPGEIGEWMNDARWFTADEAKAAGFVDVVDGASSTPTNSINDGPRVRIEDRVQALGLGELLTPDNAANPKETDMTVEQLKKFAADNPDAVKELDVVNKLAEERYDQGKADASKAATPKNATAAELKAAFPDDTGFVMDRLDHDAPMNEHKVAYAEHLQQKLAAKQQELDAAKSRLAEIDPAEAGTTPVNVAKDPEPDEATRLREDSRKWAESRNRK